MEVGDWNGIPTPGDAETLLDGRRGLFDPSGRPLLTRIAAVAALPIVTALAACVAQPAMTFVPAPASCRTPSTPHTTPSAAEAVTWIGPDDPRDRLKLDAWCATVGPVVVEAGPPLSGRDVLDELAVLTWNTHVGAGDVAALVERLRRGDFTGGAPVRHFVLLLQEVYRQGPEVPDAAAASIALPAPILVQPARGERRTIRDVARSLGLHLVYAPAMRNGPRDEDRGNAILATLPLSEVQVIELPFERQRRVAIVATVRAATQAGAPWPLQVATTHFDTGLALTRGGPAAARGRQARALIDVLGAAPAPIVVGGDFNTWWGDEEPAVRDLRRTFPDAQPPRAAATWGGVFRTIGALDHMFVRVDGRRLEILRLPDRLGSDHYPLMTIVTAR